MKKKYFLILLLSISFFSFSQDLKENMNFNIIENYINNKEVNLSVDLIDESKEMNPSINIFDPIEGQIFDETTTAVNISYDILDFPSFTPGADGYVRYSVRENDGDYTVRDIEITDATFSLSVESGTNYEVTIELVDASRNPFSPAIESELNFSVAASTSSSPSLVITSPEEGTVFDAEKEQVTINYEIRDFPSFTLGTDGSIIYRIRKNGDEINIQDDFTADSFIVGVNSGNTYEVEMELVDTSRNSFSPAIKTVVSFSVAEATANLPSVVITSPTAGQVLDAGTSNVTILYEALDFPDFTNGTIDGFVSYTISKTGDPNTRTATQGANINVSWQVSPGDYFVQIELLDNNRESFSPAILASVNFSVAEATANPSINIFDPTEGQIFDETTTAVNISYDILDFPSFTPGADGYVRYSVRENDGDYTARDVEITDATFSLSVKSGTNYEVTIELVDASRNPFSPVIESELNFSVAASTSSSPSLVITSPEEGTVFDAEKEQVTINYEIRDFPSFTLGTDGSIIYRIRKNGDEINIQDDFTADSFIVDVNSGNTYEVEMELVDTSRNSFSPAIKTVVSFSVAEATANLPSAVITSPTAGQVLDAGTSSVTILYEALDFPDFTNGTIDGFVSYTISKTGDPNTRTATQGANINVSWQVSPGDYFVQIELLDNNRESFSPAILASVNFSVAEATVNPSINIFDPTAGQVFDETTTAVNISYDILDFPSFTPGADGYVRYSVRENNGDYTLRDVEITDATFSLSVKSGTNYEVTIELVDASRNPFSPAIESELNFSVAEATANPSIIITSPKSGETLSPITTEVEVNYEIKDFPAFTPGSDGFVKYTVWKNGDQIISKDDFIDIIFDATSGNYSVDVELLNNSKEPFSPRILTSSSFFIQDGYRVVNSLEELGSSDRGAFYELINEVTITYDTKNDQDQKYIQDNTAGFLIDDQNEILITNYKVGDAIIGLKGQYVEDATGKKFIPVEEPTDIISSENVVAPKQLTLKELSENIQVYQSQRVTVENVSFDIADGVVKFDSSVSKNYVISNGEDKMNFRLEFDGLDLEGTIIPQGTFDITGIATISSTASKGNSNGFHNILALELKGIVAGVEENTIDGFNVFPNPVTKNKTFIVTSSSFTKKKVFISNVLGKEVYTKNISGINNEINVQRLDTGVYFLRVIESGRTATRKLLIK